ncbi:hypothetical protein Dimus_012562 [Dionaea muscipula]
MVIGNLTKLRELQLDYVSINSTLPRSMNNLSSLSSLSLNNCNLLGEFPVEILNLPHLRALDVGYNFGLHANFSLLPSWSSPLEVLDFYWCDFSGVLPLSVRESMCLRTFDITGCNFYGSIPSWVWNITERILMSSNHFVGELPSSVNTSKLSYLTGLKLSANQLIGAIPLWLFTLPSLNTLSLKDNHFIGELLSSMNTSKLSYLTDLDLSDNQLSGAIPSWLFTLPSLNTLSLDQNLFTGSLSEFTATNTSTGKDSLLWLDLSHNSLTGTLEQIPWNNMQGLHLDFNMFEGQLPILPPYTLYFTAANNRFSGYLPSTLCDLEGLYELDLSNNSLVGEIPPCFGNLTSKFLGVLNLRSNSITGILLPIFGQCSGLSILSLSGNRLEGPIPRSLTNCSSMEFIDLGNNRFNDTFPHWLGALPSLKVLVLRSNNFYVQTVKGFSRNLDKVTGTLAIIDVSSNRLEGGIPKSLGDLACLRWLNLSHNNFNGSIPPSLGNLKLIESLDLSSNELAGQIPPGLQNLDFLELFNVSYNQLVGSIPQENQFNSFENGSYLGNPGLCGFPLSKKCKKDEAFDLPPPPTGGSGDDYMDPHEWEIVMMGYGFGLVVGLVIGYFMFLERTPLSLLRLFFSNRTLRVK